MQPGPANTITDVPGIRVGQVQRTDDGWLTGVTVVLPPPEGAVGGVDVRGGGPGTRETDLLDPRNLVERVHAVVLAGGSALGLAAADGVARALLEDGVGFPVGGPGEVVPIVPAAILFDLGRGGVFGRAPDAEMGRAAYAAATGEATGEVAGTVGQGTVGAGTGARAGGLKGGVGTASLRLDDGTTVGALVAVNATGSCVDPADGTLYAARHCRPGDLPQLTAPSAEDLRAATDLMSAGPPREAPGDRPQSAPPQSPPIQSPLATTIGVIATDATLTKAGCAKVAGIGHDGLARAVNPVHTMFDGDTLFALATGARPAPGHLEFHALLGAAADCVTRAVARAVLAATPAGGMRTYREVYPSAFVGGGS